MLTGVRHTAVLILGCVLLLLLSVGYSYSRFGVKMNEVVSIETTIMDDLSSVARGVYSLISSNVGAAIYEVVTGADVDDSSSTQRVDLIQDTVVWSGLHC